MKRSKAVPKQERKAFSSKLIPLFLRSSIIKVQLVSEEAFLT